MCQKQAKDSHSWRNAQIHALASEFPHVRRARTFHSPASYCYPLACTDLCLLVRTHLRGDTCCVQDPALRGSDKRAMGAQTACPYPCQCPSAIHPCPCHCHCPCPRLPMSAPLPMSMLMPLPLLMSMPMTMGMTMTMTMTMTTRTMNVCLHAVPRSTRCSVRCSAVASHPAGLSCEHQVVLQQMGLRLHALLLLARLLGGAHQLSCACRV